MLRDYANIRLDITQRPGTRDDLAATIEKSNALQEKLWQQAMAMVATDNAMVPTGLFIQTLNETIDDHAKRLAALRNRVPNIVLLALFAQAASTPGAPGCLSS